MTWCAEVLSNSLRWILWKEQYSFGRKNSGLKKKIGFFSVMHSTYQVHLGSKERNALVIRNHYPSGLRILCHHVTGKALRSAQLTAGTQSKLCVSTWTRCESYLYFRKLRLSLNYLQETESEIGWKILNTWFYSKTYDT